MNYTLLVEYLPSELLQNATRPTNQPFKLFKDHGSLKKAMTSLMELDLREFSAEAVVNQQLSQHLISAAIVDDKLHVVATLRILEGFENIGMPPGIYVQIDRSRMPVEDFERKSDFPLSAYTAYGPRNNHFLLRAQNDLHINHRTSPSHTPRKPTRIVKNDKLNGKRMR